MIAAAALLLVLLDPAQQTPAPRDTRPAAAGTAAGRIAGVVVTDEAQPRPLRRARVSLTGGGLEMPLTAITADNGAFTFDGLPAGRFTLTASKDAYVSMAYGARRPGRPGTGIELAAGQAAAVTVRLPRGAVITGTVLDVDGRPAAGLSVSALYPRVGGTFGDRQWVSPPGALSSTTDDRGVYRIFGLPAGEYIVAAQVLSRPGFAGTNDVRMMVGNTVSRMMSMSQVLHPGVTDPSRAGRIAVRAGEERGGVDVQLEYVPLVTVNGTVSSPAGWGPARVILWRTDETAQLQSAPVVSADPQGRFTFRSIAPGNYRLSARAAQSPAGGRGSAAVGEIQYAFLDVAVGGDDIEGLALSLQPGLSIGGRVTFESSQAAPPALPQLSVPSPLVLARENGGWPMPAVAIEDGRFLIRGITPGPYRMPVLPRGVRVPIGNWWLKSLVAGGRDLLDAPINLDRSIDDAVITFTDRVSEVGGTLRDAGGAAAPEFVVIAFPADRAGWFLNSRRIASVRPGRDGRWSISNLPPGEYRLAAGDLEQGEWFDPAVLERLLPGATGLRVTGPERYTIDLVIR